MRIICCIFFSIFLSLLSANCQLLDIQKSIVDFKVKSMKVHTIHGSFRLVSGIIKLDSVYHEDEMLVLHINVPSINTGMANRDNVLKSEDFFNTELYPTISFYSEQVVKTSENKWLAKGMLNIKGVSRIVEIPFLLTEKEVKGDIWINRLDYGIGGEGTFLVDKKVNISFNLSCS
ncbi:YceI family protein [Labilibacter marinus]|uniref:YceI family protein n=1 Tax=Labilibacter marinus TaxID=1477105 RepID=UPI00094F7F4F|nr:YceI family protein [Labilibacter marinus]